MNKKNKMLLILGFMAFLANGDNYAVALLLINIANDLGLQLSTAAISVSAYMLSFGLFTILFGPLSDRFGKVQIITIAAFGTSIFSILGGFAFNLPSLIFFRAVNGAFAAGIFPVTLALVGQSFDDNSRHKAIGKVMGLMFLGGAMATIIGGALAYFASWRLVYIGYGVAELLVSFIMIKFLEKDSNIVEKLRFFNAYKAPLSNMKFMRLVFVIFLVGFSVFGSFTYSGKLIQSISTLNILQIGIILSLFGVGTVLGGKIAPKIKKSFGNIYFLIAGAIGFTSLAALGSITAIWLLCLGFIGFGVAFIMMQSSLVGAAQEMLPKMRGTAMSLASFNMFVGGAIGTAVNGLIVKNFNIANIYLITAFIFLIATILATIFIGNFKKGT